VTWKRGGALVGGAASLLLRPEAARADVRWDLGLEEGAQKRVLVSKPAGGEDAEVGTTLDVVAHVSLVPLVRLGLYGHYDVSPLSDGAGRDVFSGGIDARVLSPWPQGPLRLYARLGVGEAGTTVLSHEAPGGSFVGAASGVFTEVPIALGLQYRVDRRLALNAELGTRLGLGFAGTAYGAPSSGDDIVSVFLAAGVSWGR
jgi:hypothetical protein